MQSVPNSSGHSQKLVLGQKQSLVVTPQLQQALKVLQMSSIELEAFIDLEMANNPFLEREDGVQDDEPLSALDDNSAYDDVAEYGPDWSEAEGMKEWSTVRHDLDSLPSLEQSTPQQRSLYDDILEQISLSFTLLSDRLIAMRMLESLDETGYWRGAPEEVALALNCSVEKVLETLKKLQEFEPTGLFARSLSECLELQLKERNIWSRPFQILLSELELLAKGELKKLCKLCAVDLESLRSMIATIKQLEPKPSRPFGSVHLPIVKPDVYVRPVQGGGEWTVELNQDALPKVLVNTQYFERVKTQGKNKEEGEFLKEKFKSASFITKAMHQRAMTIMRTASEIVKRQESFFKHGIEYLKPMTMKDISEALDLHESTISRVTNHKYIQTPRGIFEMKFFFTSSLSSNQYDVNYSSTSVRYRIKSLIDAETPQKVLSDDDLVDILKAEGIDIARRTVAKYRDMMKIPTSAQRKRTKRGNI